MNLVRYHEAELTSRMSSAWKSFAKFKHVLCSRRYPLSARLKLFESVVTSTALYGSSCWTVWAKTQQVLRSTWRQMMRKIVQIPRQQHETWVHYIRRSTRLCVRMAEERGFRDWVETQQARKAGFIIRNDGDTHDKWNRKLVQWTPWFRTFPTRRTGRPCKRWSDF